MIDEAFRELATVAESHEPEIIDAPEPNLTEDELSRPTSSDSSPHPPISKTEHGTLRVDTQVGHVLHPPSSAIGSSGRLSPALTSESDRDEYRKRSAARQTITFPSFHLPTRRNSHRERSAETSHLSSASRSSLRSSSSASQNSGLYTPPHSPPAASFPHADIMSPSSQLSAISELQNIEDHFDYLFLQPIEEKSTLTTRARRSGSSLRVHSESDGQEEPAQAATTTAARAIPNAADAYVHRPTDSPTDTVTGPLPSAFSITSSSRSHRSQVPAPLPCPLSPAASLASREASPEPPPEMLPPSPVSAAGRSWPFVGRSVSVSLSLGRAEKAEQKKRKKEVARARKEQFTLEKRRNEVLDVDGASSKRIPNPRAWEEDIATYGSLASM